MKSLKWVMTHAKDAVRDRYRLTGFCKAVFSYETKIRN